MSVDVRPVHGIRELRRFVELPYRLHEGTPWVPPLRLERYTFLSRRLNPYFKHGVAEYFLARRADRVVGRITAQVDHAFNEFHGSKWGMFGFLELEDDPEALEAMLTAVEHPLELVHLVVAERPQLRPRKPAAVEDRGVVAGVADHGVTGAEDGSDAAEVRLVAGGEDDRVLGFHPLGELALELDV